MRGVKKALEPAEGAGREPSVNTAWDCHRISYKGERATPQTEGYRELWEANSSKGFH